MTAHPYAAWAAQQIVEAVGLDDNVVHLIRDRDGIYGAAFNERVRNLGIEQLRTAPRSPWKNGYAERWVGKRFSRRMSRGAVTDVSRHATA